MTITEVLKSPEVASGKAKFTRNGVDIFEVNQLGPMLIVKSSDGTLLSPTVKDLTIDDWYILENPITITPSQLRMAFEKSCKDMTSHYPKGYYHIPEEQFDLMVEYLIPKV